MVAHNRLFWLEYVANCGASAIHDISGMTYPDPEDWLPMIRQGIERMYSAA